MPLDELSVVEVTFEYNETVFDWPVLQRYAPALEELEEWIRAVLARVDKDEDTGYVVMIRYQRLEGISARALVIRLRIAETNRRRESKHFIGKAVGHWLGNHLPEEWQRDVFFRIELIEMDVGWIGPFGLPGVEDWALLEYLANDAGLRPMADPPGLLGATHEETLADAAREIQPGILED